VDERDQISVTHRLPDELHLVWKSYINWKLLGAGLLYLMSVHGPDFYHQVRMGLEDRFLEEKKEFEGLSDEEFWFKTDGKVFSIIKNFDQKYTSEEEQMPRTPRDLAMEEALKRGAFQGQAITPAEKDGICATFFNAIGYPKISVDDFLEARYGDFLQWEEPHNFYQLWPWNVHDKEEFKRQEETVNAHFIEKGWKRRFQRADYLPKSYCDTAKEIHDLILSIFIAAPSEMIFWKWFRRERFFNRVEVPKKDSALPWITLDFQNCNGHVLMNLFFALYLLFGLEKARHLMEQLSTEFVGQGKVRFPESQEIGGRGNLKRFKAIINADRSVNAWLFVGRYFRGFTLDFGSELQYKAAQGEERGLKRYQSKEKIFKELLYWVYLNRDPWTYPEGRILRHNLMVNLLWLSLMRSAVHRAKADTLEKNKQTEAARRLFHRKVLIKTPPQK
jgi:hypothetical protein